MNKAYCFEEDGYSCVAVAENDKLVRLYKLEKNFLTGSIFIGKVKKVNKSVGIFVDVGLDKDALLTFREGVKPGDYLTVMINREPTEEKGAAATEKLTLAGRYCVLNDVGEYKFSRSISEDKKVELFRLKRYDNVGFVFRSACERADLSEIETEQQTLVAKYSEIKEAARNVYGIKRLYSDDALSVAKRLSDDGTVYEPDEKLKKCLSELKARKVVVQGVELVFDYTEAMTVVDVNIHKYSAGDKDVESANLNADLIAVAEIARQIRLRNIGGIVMVDYISLKDKRNKETLMKRLNEELKKDFVTVRAESLDSVGLIAIVRKKRYSSF